MIGTGRVCGTSESRPPSVTTNVAPRLLAVSISVSLSDCHRIAGSGPVTRMRSRRAVGTTAARSSTVGQSRSDATPSRIVMCGR
ncbi:unannotated protein [freshwater metagenome]|uniref:Unannotated protein n=1 Tax=freshwater metagenome TaxID=449393 RepID=A0A6J7I6X6_9ZZZZ